MKSLTKLVLSFFIIINLCLLYSSSLIGQMTFERTYGTIDDNMGYSVEVCPDNSFIICGSTTDYYNGSENIYIIKVDNYGEIIWSKEFGSEYPYAVAFDICASNDDGYIVTGYLYESFDEHEKPYILKINSYGEKVWLKLFDNFYRGQGKSIVQMENDDIAICGIFGVTQYLKSSFFIRTDSSGEIVSEETYSVNIGEYNASEMKIDSESCFFISGVYSPDDKFYAWLIKTDEYGHLLWDNYYHNNDRCYTFSALETTADSGIINCGTKTSCIPYPHQYRNIYLVKTDNNGIQQWSNEYGNNDEERAYDIDITPDGDFIICGSVEYEYSYNTDILLFKVSNEGDSLWSRSYGGDYYDNSYSIKALEDGGYIICGLTNSYGYGGRDVYLLRTNDDGIITNIYHTGELRNNSAIYPNPATDYINLSAKKAIRKYQIFNTDFRIMADFTAATGKEIINKRVNTSNFPPGLYFVKITTDSGISTSKFIITN
jgi:hypothetical protein